jgi:hypothetical protein
VSEQSACGDGAAADADYSNPTLRSFIKSIVNNVQDSRKTLGGKATDVVYQDEFDAFQRAYDQVYVEREAENAPGVIRDLQTYFDDPANHVSGGLTVRTAPVTMADGRVYQEVDTAATVRGLTDVEANDVYNFLNTGLTGTTANHKNILDRMAQGYTVLRAGCVLRL